MKQKKNVRAAKTLAQQIEDLKRTISKYGDYDGTRRHQLDKLTSIQNGISVGFVPTVGDTVYEKFPKK